MACFVAGCLLNRAKFEKGEIGMARVILFSLLLSVAHVSKLQAQDGNASQQEVNDLKSQLQTEHQRVEQLLETVQQLQKRVDQMQSGGNSTAAVGTTAQGAVLKQPAATARSVSPQPVTATQTVSSSSTSEQPPTAIHFKGVTLTPGGFLDATGIIRTHNTNADVISTFGSIPFDGTANANLSEFRATARATRFSLLAEGKVKDWKASGYAEFDFEGAAPTANEIESNSFQPRSRQLWGQVEFNNGFTISGGQSWSLLTTNRKGLALRQEWVPNTIDLQYVVGYNWARQWGIRATKNFNNKIWAAVAVENPETTLNVTNPPPDVFGFNTSPNATTPLSAFTPSTSPGANGISTDLAPDLIGKVVFEPGWGHYEIKAVGRFFRDRVGGSNNYTATGGGGIAAVLPLTKKLDLFAEGLAGTGIGRYASGSGADVTLRPNGTVVPIRTLQTSLGLEAHPGSRWDVYLYGGNEYYSRASYVNAAGLPVGFGSPLNNNSGCQVEVPAANQPCQAQNRTVWEIEPGYWFRFYKGEAGTVAMGMSYSYIRRTTWAGAAGLQPTGNENMVMTSFRYYLP
jgi:cell division protein FtsB